MPIQVYKCPKHGEWELFMAFKDDVKPTNKCPHSLPQAGQRFPQFCLRISKHILKPIAAAIVSGGTGAGKDMHLKR
ncbi:hypothetical protein LCGC14_2977070 [marine sediment metagenome]|uniref:Uncharacterized protein n=1 Tax=marine sediment metagenome TaxID=412755 RepID=A0A0F8X8J3_9ZZZZ